MTLAIVAPPEAGPSYPQVLAQLDSYYCRSHLRTTRDVVTAIHRLGGSGLSIKMLSEHTLLSESTVKRTLRALKGAGLLAATTTQLRSGAYDANVYHFTHPVLTPGSFCAYTGCSHQHHEQRVPRALPVPAGGGRAQVLGIETPDQGDPGWGHGEPTGGHGDPGVMVTDGSRRPEHKIDRARARAMGGGGGSFSRNTISTTTTAKTEWQPTPRAERPANPQPPRELDAAYPAFVRFAEHRGRQIERVTGGEQGMIRKTVTEYGLDFVLEAMEYLLLVSKNGGNWTLITLRSICAECKANGIKPLERSARFTQRAPSPVGAASAAATYQPIRIQE